MPKPRWWKLVLLALPLGLVAGCADYSALAFHQDHRLSITSPESRAVLSPPFTLRWTMKDFDVAARGEGPPRDDAGYFAVFVDRAPVKPGHTPEDVADDDQTCKRDPGCPDRSYLAGRGVYTTTRTSLRIPVIPPLSSKEKVQLHEVDIVLLDSSGRRIGEAAWYLEFKTRNRTFE